MPVLLIEGLAWKHGCIPRCPITADQQGHLGARTEHSVDAAEPQRSVLRKCNSANLYI